MGGKLFTVTRIVSILTQLFVSVPVTVKLVVTVREGVIVAVVAPVFQMYVLAPWAIKIAVSPAQIVGVFTVMVGKAFTIIVTVCVAVQVPVLAPVTV